MTNHVGEGNNFQVLYCVFEIKHPFVLVLGCSNVFFLPLGELYGWM